MDVHQSASMVANKEVYRSFKPFFIILKVFGLACYKLDEKTEELKTAFLDWVLFFASIFLWAVLIWMQIFKKMHTNYVSGIDSSILENLWQYQFVLQHFFGLVVSIFNFWHRKSIGKLLKLIFDFDRKIKKLGWSYEPRSKVFKRSVIAFVVGLTILLVYDLIYSIINNSLKNNLAVHVLLYNLFNFHFIILFYVIVSLQFIVGVYCVRSRLGKINDNLR